MAKDVNLIAVKVLSSASGSSSDIIKGLDWVITNHDQRKTQPNWAGSVASMSLGAPQQSTSIDQAVKETNSAGIHFAVAAGNDNQDACNSSPAAATTGSDVVSVGATTIQDARASFSNFGTCTTVYAPGQDITSTWIGGTSKINTISGTSMACPRKLSPAVVMRNKPNPEHRCCWSHGISSNPRFELEDQHCSDEIQNHKPF